MANHVVSKNSNLEMTYSAVMAQADCWSEWLRSAISTRTRPGTPVSDWSALVEQGDIFFMQAWEDPSNLEYEWLWLYNHVQRAEQKMFCLQKALFINPDSDFAQKELRKMQGVWKLIPAFVA